MTPGNTEAAVTIINGNWGLTSLSAIRAVLSSAHRVLVRSFEAAPEAAVHVSRWNRDYPFTVYEKRPYQVFLSATDTYWSQYVYQFSHELCHILTHFDSYKKHKHKWFEESLCELASLHVLRSLAKVWKEDPPSGSSKLPHSPGIISHMPRRSKRKPRYLHSPIFPLGLTGTSTCWRITPPAGNSIVSWQYPCQATSGKTLPFGAIVAG